MPWNTTGHSGSTIPPKALLASQLVMQCAESLSPNNKAVTNSSCIWEKQSFEQTVAELGSFNTIEGFWSYWSHLRVGGLKDNCNLRMFQKGIRPTSEVRVPDGFQSEMDF